MSAEPAPEGRSAIAPARLLALRLQGFKSFAERTIVEFGPGISAVVGPNGSGKSNLADALRWALGEQGKALRSRKSEDVIFAGSDKRAALGMADVTLVLDNADALLPVEYDVLEIGRRLYRSGENDYLLNRQRIRLRDLVDLLDAAHLADNAFLFIGQGMVDQALALRPEERRPLFEEVAGVRRHERRRRRAEEQLVEAEANLARVGDVLAEIRPQARRLAAQAEQQASRLTAGEELAHALMVGAHARWHAAAGAVVAAAGRLATTRGGVDAALVGLQVEEDAATAIAAALGQRADREAERRAAHDAARAVLTGLQLREARLSGDLAAMSRDRRRLEDERAVAETDRVARRRELAEPVPARDRVLEEHLGEAERALREGLEELGALRATDAARSDELASLRRAEAARGVELDTATRRSADVERRLADEAARALGASERHAGLERRVADARVLSAAAATAEVAAREAREAARVVADECEGRRRVVAEAGIAAGGRLAGLRGRLEALVARLAEEEARGIARAARRRGGRRLDEDLRVEPALRAAVEAALGDSIRAYLVPLEAVGDLASERGVLVVRRDARPASVAPPEALREAMLRCGATILADAVRSEASGAVRRLLETAVCVPDLAAAMTIQPALPVGWAAVVRDGSAVVARHTVVLGRPDALLERRAEVERLSGQVEAAEAEAARAARAVTVAESEAGEARAALERAREAESAAGSERRRADEAERAAGREAEASAREAAWLAAQVTRLEGEAARQREIGQALRAAEADATRPRVDGGALVAAGAGPGALTAWEARVAELRDQRDRLAAVVDEEDRRRREAEGRRARAEAAAALDDDRIGRAERDLETLGRRERELADEREALMREVLAATAREEAARSALDELHAADVRDRARLAAAEEATAVARDRLRAAEERLRASEVADLEARLGLDAIREQLLVELAGLGELGLRALGVPGPVDDETIAFEASLAERAHEWAASPPGAEPASPGRLAYLRRRYHELGTANPFAVEEYAAVRMRLESLEAQDGDLRAAIVRTRSLIEELDVLIADRFRATFRALEMAFDARFRQLFGGGFARLSLTDPADLGSTGVEIVARPPGKKAQALAMLSGGERALTAVALLFAMLEVRPVPFCVLDEVDAALDEANVGRFSEALRSLAGRTQFVVITHNRGTIEVADALYGVTVGEDSVSRVVSLRLEEAQAFAERARAIGDIPVG